MTKIDVLNLIAELCADNEDIVKYCENECAMLTRKAEKARDRAAKKKAQGDELYANVCDCVGSEWVTADEVFDKLEDDSLSVAKVRTRLSQAVNNGVLTKENQRLGGKSKVFYKKAE